MHTFSAATRQWFEGAFAAATLAQLGAWESIANGSHTLVVAPTGSGKTLAAFLSALDRLATTPKPTDPIRRCRVLYISPLKALAVDVERNLRAPLAGIRQAAMRLGLPEPDITVATRSGDTPAKERRIFAKAPADILITTPESLFLLLTSSARDSLRGVDTVIVDEVHSVMATKRGAHLALSLERLDCLLDRPAQRIGLSATVRPIDEVTTFLAGGRAVEVVEPPREKVFQLEVVVPVSDMTALDELDSGADSRTGASAPSASIWPHVEERVLDLVQAHRSTIIFANSRRLSERLTARLNELATIRATDRIAAQVDGAAAPAEVMGQSGTGMPAGTLVVARAHHGSVSKEQRAVVEDELKRGTLPAVVATSSLELGIDMGAVDLVIQIESPPSVASGLQRIGRAGHQVGAVSRGVIFPKYRGDLVECTVVAERMRAGQIESMSYPRNPLDVLAQQIVAMVAMDSWTVDELEAFVHRCAPFAGLPHSALLAVLDMLAGRYPSDAFAELRPRLIWDRDTGVLTPRRAAQRLAVTNGGTIPDRGLFGVFLASGDGPSRRVGELDEEMVYESRVGDVFLLGSSSWRIEEITHDQVLVTPAPGQVGRMPFWKGDSPGRPIELGKALGAFLRELNTMESGRAATRLQNAGLDKYGVANLLAYLAEQREATRQLPSDRTIVVERCRDELGDWRLIVHSPFGAPVNGPWALAISARVQEQTGISVQTMHSDDGIVLRLAETDAEPPTAELALFDHDAIAEIVTSQVGSSSLFAARFRECAARSLLLPRRDPRRRTPLWQQRQRAHQLLQVASEYGEFPIVLETMRECLQDVYDLPGLTSIMRDIAAGTLNVVEVETQTPSPFARSLLFGYIGMFLYDADAPLAERRAQALSLDTGLLAELLGTTDLRELLELDVLVEVEGELQRTVADRKIEGADSLHDLLRIIGDLSIEEIVARGGTTQDVAELVGSRRAIMVRISSDERCAAIEDAGRLRDALGCALPVGVPEVFTEPVRDPLGDLVTRYARTHGPFHAHDIAARLGLGSAMVTSTLERLRSSGAVVEGEFMPVGWSKAQDVGRREWCETQVLRSIRRRSLARLRNEVEPVPQRALASLTLSWQEAGTRHLHGADGLLRAVEQLAGTRLALSALETLILPQRCRDYSPELLDQLTLAGEVHWVGAGALPGKDGWIVLSPADLSPMLLPDPSAETVAGLSELAASILTLVHDDHGVFLSSLAEQLAAQYPDLIVTPTMLNESMWELLWSGCITNDTIAPLRSLISGGKTSLRPQPLRRPRFGRLTALGLASSATSTYGTVRGAAASTSSTLTGRWSRPPRHETDSTRVRVTQTQTMLDRYGLVTREVVTAEGTPGGFSAIYQILKAAEERGAIRRGYFVDGLGAAQFASTAAVEQLRSISAFSTEESDADPAIVLAASDPANPYGAALAWPAVVVPRTDVEAKEATIRGHQPARKAGALVVLRRGLCVLFAERGGRSLLTFTDDPGELRVASTALAHCVIHQLRRPMLIERINGMPVSKSDVAAALIEAGFRAAPNGGLRLRAPRQ